jgi:hypothetical protein
MSTAPLIGFTAPAAGTGKSLLVDVMSVLATGRLMPVLSQGKNEEEFEKRWALVCWPATRVSASTIARPPYPVRCYARR